MNAERRRNDWILRLLALVIGVLTGNVMPPVVIPEQPAQPAEIQPQPPAAVAR